MMIGNVYQAEFRIAITVVAKNGQSLFSSAFRHAEMMATANAAVHSKPPINLSTRVAEFSLSMGHRCAQTADNEYNGRGRGN
jgi:hypothetical protein